jgi:hypothetical protein
VNATNETHPRRGYLRDPRGGTTAIIVVALGVPASLSAPSGSALAELTAFALVAACAVLFLSRVGTLVLALGMTVLAVWGNYDISAVPLSHPTGAALGTAAFLFLLFIVAVVGIGVDLTARLVWIALHWEPPTE